MKQFYILMPIILLSCTSSPRQEAENDPPAMKSIVILDDRALTYLDPEVELETLSCGYKWMQTSPSASPSAIGQHRHRPITTVNSKFTDSLTDVLQQ